MPREFVEEYDGRGRRARTVMACALAAAVAAVGATLGLANPPPHQPHRTGRSTWAEAARLPSGQTTIRPDVRPGDVHGFDVLATATNVQPLHRGATDLSATVRVHTDSALGGNHMVSYCRSHRDRTWVVRTYGGSRQYVECRPEARVSLAPTHDIAAWTARVGARPVTARMSAVLPPAAMRRCLLRGVDDVACERSYGPPRPLARTDAEFGFRVYEHPAERIVLKALGYHFEALSTDRGTPWVLDRAVVAAPAASFLAVALAESEVRRRVDVYATRRDLDRCAEPTDPGRGRVRPAGPVRVCGVGLRLTVDGQPARRGPGRGFGYPWAPLAPGSEHQVVVEVVRGDPHRVRLALIVRHQVPSPP